MPSNKGITEESYIRDLPFSSLRYLSAHLDPDELWKRFVVFVPKNLDSQQPFQERYSAMQVKLFEERGTRKNGSATSSIINDWCTQNPRIKHLLKALTDAELYAAADYLSVKVLGHEPVARRASVTHIPSPSDILPDPPSFSPAQNIDGFDEKKFHDKKNLSDLTDKNTVIYSRSNSASVQMARIPSFDVYPSTDAEAGPPQCSVEKSQKQQNSDNVCSGGQFTLPEIFPQTKIQEFSYKALSLITNGFDDRCYSDGGRIIGSGGFGKVYLGIPSNGYKVAIKTLKTDDDASKDQQYQSMMNKQFQTELETLSKYRHEHIVPFIGFSIDEQQKCLVYQYMPNGSLEDRLGCVDNTKPLPWKLRVTITLGTAEGIVYLNDNKLVHRDIKSANVLLDENFSPKVGDFATVRVAPSGSGLSTLVSTKLVIGTSAYMAPEAPRFDISAKLDSFAFGVVLLEILTGLPPLDETRSENDLLSYIEENCDDEDISEYLDSEAGEWDTDVANVIYSISKKCVENKKKDRVLVSQVLPQLQELVKEL